MGELQAGCLVEAAVQVKPHGAAAGIIDRGEVQPAAQPWQHGRARIRRAFLFIGVGGQDIAAQGETHGGMARHHPVHLTGLARLPAVGVQQRLVGRAQLVEPHPGGEGQLRPVAVAAGIELEVVAQFGEFRRPRAGPAALDDAEAALLRGVALEVEQGDEGGIAAQIRESLFGAGALTGGETGAQAGHFVGLDEGRRTQLARRSPLQRQGVAAAQALRAARAAGFGDDLALEDVDLGVAAGRHINAEARAEIDGLAGRGDDGEAVGRGRHVGGEAASLQAQALGRFKAELRRGFQHEPGAACADQRQRAGVEAMPAAAQAVALGQAGDPGRLGDGGMGRARGLPGPGAEPEQGQAGGGGQPACRLGGQAAFLRRRDCGDFPRGQGREGGIQVELFDELAARRGIVLQTGVEFRSCLGGQRAVEVGVEKPVEFGFHDAASSRARARRMQSSSSRRMRCSH